MTEDTITVDTRPLNHGLRVGQAVYLGDVILRPSWRRPIARLAWLFRHGRKDSVPKARYVVSVTSTTITYGNDSEVGPRRHFDALTEGIALFVLLALMIAVAVGVVALWHRWTSPQ